MFGSKKRLQELEKEKQELLFIKQQLEEVTPKIDISDIYVWEENGIYNIVQLNIQKCHGINPFGQEVDGYISTLIDVFSNKIVYEKSSTNTIKSKELIYDRKKVKDSYYAYFYPVYQADRNLLAYADKKVPLYVLQQLYYRLNHINIKSYGLKEK